jgi:hypothetical protein
MAFKSWWKCLTINSLEIVSENKSISGYHLGYLINNPDLNEKLHKDINALLTMFQEKKIQVTIDSTHGFSKASDAFKLMHNHMNVGKVLLKPDCEMPPPLPSAAVPIEENAATKVPTTPTVVPTTPEAVKIETTTDTKETPKDAKDSPVPEKTTKANGKHAKANGKHHTTEKTPTEKTAEKTTEKPAEIVEKMTE